MPNVPVVTLLPEGMDHPAYEDTPKEAMRRKMWLAYQNFYAGRLTAEKLAERVDRAVAEYESRVKEADHADS